MGKVSLWKISVFNFQDPPPLPLLALSLPIAFPGSKFFQPKHSMAGKGNKRQSVGNKSCGEDYSSILIIISIPTS